MIRGWNITSSMTETFDDLTKKAIIQLDAEPVFAEIGEKVMELTGELHEKILNEELKWSLMMTPLKMIHALKDMCENEISRRELEIKELTKEKEDGNLRTQESLS